MADIAGLEPASCGFKSRSPYHFWPSEPLGRSFDSPALRPSGPPALEFQALSSAGQNSGLIIRESRVRIPQGQLL